jgi:protein-tyrosine-phosphatase
MDVAESKGAKTEIIEVCDRNIVPCKELIVCEKKGYCPIDDDMSRDLYNRLWEADVVVAASPVFFYSVTAQLKAFIDRCQTLWARKYRLKLIDPGRAHRLGYTLSVAATKGKNLFDGIHLTAKYLFDAVGARYAGSLTYRDVEKRSDMAKHPTVHDNVSEAVNNLLAPLIDRKKLVFIGKDNSCFSQMAQAFARYTAGDKVDTDSAGINPAEKLDPMMIEVMSEKGIDMGFRKPKAMDAINVQMPADIIVQMDSSVARVEVKGQSEVFWQLEGLTEKSIDGLRRIRDDIATRVHQITSTL